MTILSLGNRRIPARSCKVPPDTSSSTRSASCCGGGGDDELSTELMRSLVEERTRGFLLSTIATQSFLYHTQNPSFAFLKPTPIHNINSLSHSVTVYACVCVNIYRASERDELSKSMKLFVLGVCVDAINLTVFNVIKSFGLGFQNEKRTNLMWAAGLQRKFKSFSIIQWIKIKEIVLIFSNKRYSC